MTWLHSDVWEAMKDWLLAIAAASYLAAVLSGCKDRLDEAQDQASAYAAQRQREYEDELLLVPGRYHSGQIELDNIPDWVWSRIAEIEQRRNEDD